MSIIRGLTAGLVGLTLLLSGCSSAPTNVSADIPLVSASGVRLIDTQSVAVPQGNITSGSQLQLEGNLYLVGNSYTSASGLTCRNLKPLAAMTASRAICQRDGQWQMLAPLITHTNSK